MPKRVNKSTLLFGAKVLMDVILAVILAVVVGLLASNVLIGVIIALVVVAFLFSKTFLSRRAARTDAKFRADTREQMKRIRVGLAKTPSAAIAQSPKVVQDQLRNLEQKMLASQKSIADGINMLASNSQIGGVANSNGFQTVRVPSPEDSEQPKAVLAASITKRAPRPAPIENKSSAYNPIAGKERIEWALSREGHDSWRPDDTDQPYRGSSLPYSHQIPVAMIADDFTFGSFQPEFNTVRLMPKTWRQQMDAHKPQMFICESAWQGGSPEEHPWQGMIYTSIKFTKENRKQLIEILAYCHENGIPTVFWNKEDPVHFSDRINDFIRTSALFDYVFTTAVECVDLYIRDVGVPYADVLPFAVQPKLFNPIGSYGAGNSVNFAGTWYGRYPKRAKAASKIIDNILTSENEMVIYDRMYSSPDKAYSYPERYKKYTRPAISYAETADTYRQSKYGITLNTVTNSDTMFARRVFELAACGAVVLSNTAQGVQHFFGDSVYYADRDDFDINSITESDYLSHQRASMHIAFQNTYRHRAEQILSAVGIAYATYFDKIQLVARVHDEAGAERARTYFDKNRDKFVGLLIVLKDSADQTLAMELPRRYPSNIRVIRQIDIDGRTLRPRNVLKSRKALIVDMTDTSMLTGENLSYLIDVGSSMNEPLAVTQTPETNRFRYSRQPRPHNVLLNADQVFPTLAGRTSEPSIFLI
ncbi:glycosyltransferase [Glutamicibacter protophormiae]|uniref:CgeB family protein n=1 Tax=Glutamicibacter protophormiae TaxID=37930 RepID=UPI002A830386|nr:glycosyltransferase [Glutamicibacter protophormiae]WPR66130.1 glycosyltransferase [Glutamicibacter protophormiae]WPR69627.1 glycosyltransferase [Glutamicibacter protophormiae]